VGKAASRHPEGIRHRFGRGRRRWAIIALALIVPALACNFPQPTPTFDLEEIVRQTLAATLLADPPALTPMPLPAEATPAPPFSGLTTATPGMVSPFPAQPGALSGASIDYLALPGDTLAALARRFNVPPEQITSAQPVPPVGLIPPGQALAIPNAVGETLLTNAALPDSEVVYSATAREFSTVEFIKLAGGYLSGYQESVDGENLSGAQVVERLAVESSTNPRLLLALLEFRSGWVYGQPATSKQRSYPIGFEVPGYSGLYKELSLAAKQLRLGYYGWRAGEISELAFPDGSWGRIDPRLNAGTVALQALMANFYRPAGWSEALYGSTGLVARYTAMFGDPWKRAALVEPLFPAGMAVPELTLPFPVGERWSLTGGPHTAWLTYSPLGALDFAPVTGERACAVSRAWVTAAAPGVVVRSERNVVALDLDGDGFEGTGWVLVYLHLADQERIGSGASVQAGEALGHPSCEGGSATGTHVHLARKYNGEWIEADGPLPFVLSGWLARKGERAYQGYLVRGEEVVTARPDGSHTSIIVREK